LSYIPLPLLRHDVQEILLESHRKSEYLKIHINQAININLLTITLQCVSTTANALYELEKSVHELNLEKS
jgi:hypothetical protein